MKISFILPLILFVSLIDATGIPPGTTISLPELTKRQSATISLAAYPLINAKSWVSFPINVPVLKMGDSIVFQSKSSTGKSGNVSPLQMFAEMSEATFVFDFVNEPIGQWTPPVLHRIYGNQVTFGSSVFRPKNVDTIARIVLYNPKDVPVDNYSEMIWNVPPPPTLWVAILSLVTPAIFLILVHACCLCRSRRKHRHTMEYNKELDIPPYAYKGPPKPILSCLVPSIGKITQLLFNKPIHGYWTHYLNGHDFAWVWWPYYKEDKGAHWRMGCAFFFFLIQFLMQQVWSAQVRKSLPQAGSEGGLSNVSTAAVILNFLIVDVSLSVLKIAYRPLIRLIHFNREKVMWAQSQEPNRRTVGLVLTIFIALGFTALSIFALYSIISFIMSTDTVLFQALFISFFIFIFYRSFIRGLIVSYLMYRFAGSYGKDPEIAYVSLPHHSVVSSYGSIPSNPPPNPGYPNPYHNYQESQPIYNAPPNPNNAPWLEERSAHPQS